MINEPGMEKPLLKIMNWCATSICVPSGVDIPLSGAEAEFIIAGVSVEPTADWTPPADGERWIERDICDKYGTLILSDRAGTTHLVGQTVGLMDAHWRLNRYEEATGVKKARALIDFISSKAADDRSEAAVKALDAAVEYAQWSVGLFQQAQTKIGLSAVLRTKDQMRFDLVPSGVLGVYAHAPRLDVGPVNVHVYGFLKQLVS